MDPTATYLAMYHAMRDGDYTAARLHAMDLRDWFNKGGFYPHTYSEVEVRAYLANVLRRTAHIVLV